MSASYFFYDLETSGIDPRQDRIMQFAGHRTDLNLQPIGEPVQMYLKLTADILPDPNAILLTGITPQITLSEGVTEDDFLSLFTDEIVKPDTVFVGFNNIRFDDEFMRYTLYRNFYDAYSWEWANGCSRWDLLDVLRMARALRPDGIEWPFDVAGKPVNRLEMLTKANKIDHQNAHDALADVRATIEIAKLLQIKQPDFYDYLFNHRHKTQIAKLVESGQPFVYTSGHYPSDILHTSVGVRFGRHPNKDTDLIFDLRYDPTPFVSMSAEELAEAWQYNRDKNKIRLPIKTMKFNRNPVIAPLGVIKDKATQRRLDITLETIAKHLNLLKRHQKELYDKLEVVIEKLNEEQSLRQTTDSHDRWSVDGQLYDNFVSAQDKQTMARLHASSPDKLSKFASAFQDERLRLLLPLYKARNFPISMNDAEQDDWRNYCRHRLTDNGDNSRLAVYFSKLAELDNEPLPKNKQFLLEELQLYGQSIVPV